MELIICRGISASGKSTWAKAWASAAPARVRINRDDIRFQMYGTYHGEPIDENVVTKVEDSMIAAALSSGSSVVVDDTNIRHAFVKRIAEIGQAHGATVSVKHFHISLDEAKVRNAGRERKVPEDVLAKQYESLKSSGQVQLPQVVPVKPYIRNDSLPNAILVDIDGTIAHNNGHRSFYDWMAVGNDTPILEVIEIVEWAHQAGMKIVVMSGRDSVGREVTSGWLDEYLPFYDALFMRAENDQRKDNIVKAELFDAHVRDQYNVQFVLDDRDQVVEMWRAMGLRCLQVAPGNF